MGDAEDREAAIRALMVGTPEAVDPLATVDEPKVARTGNEVYAGGEEKRLLIRPAHVNYVESGVMFYPPCQVGDVVTMTKAAAARLDALGVTVDPDVDDEQLAADLADEKPTDEQLRTMGAADLIAYVGQNPDDRDRVRAIELARQPAKQRATVLAAVDDTPDEDESARLEEEQRTGAAGDDADR